MVSSATPAVPKSSSKISRKFGPSRRVIESSDSEDADEHNVAANEVIELTDDDEPAPINLPLPSRSRSPSKPSGVHRHRNLYADLDDTDLDDSDASPPSPLRDAAVLVLNDPPRSQCKPIPLLDNKGEGSSTPRRINAGTVRVTIDVQVTPVSAASLSPSKRQPRTGKKAEAAAKLERLKTYALNRFSDLNEKVFDNKIPTTTKIEWNNRFTSTAGKASYRRDTEGIVHSKIELGIKVLDAEDRIDRTLSHEMCHLACWIICAKLDEQHGQVFKAWAAKVERTCPGIVVSTTHDYEIHRPWNWKCDFCSFTYGRWSKSINPDEKGCGACLKGRLIPLFEQPVRRTPTTPRVSRMAASKPRDSPSAILRNLPPVKRGLSDDGREIICIHDSDSEPESEDAVVLLTTGMASATIS
ncbi:hypothetical protein BT96DRAFT_591338 [Gymnopus androsaceus JB14]|uniref:SprT-like domain-containing protein n=1 Tax=Gymnopus androsaceus JB14 TaxID=1447944 RepID=A0A6A4IJI7_9AGAR|nr:hypothetical protein BT96DRAFT_591338 [Gymnopus androsaceus JB14]